MLLSLIVTANVHASSSTNTSTSNSQACCAFGSGQAYDKMCCPFIKKGVESLKGIKVTVDCTYITAPEDEELDMENNMPSAGSNNQFDTGSEGGGSSEGASGGEACCVLKGSKPSPYICEDSSFNGGYWNGNKLKTKTGSDAKISSSCCGAMGYVHVAASTKTLKDGTVVSYPEQCCKKTKKKDSEGKESVVISSKNWNDQLDDTCCYAAGGEKIVNIGGSLVCCSSVGFIYKGSVISDSGDSEFPDNKTCRTGDADAWWR